eukprot:2773774-Amphidinium_carterae.1
MLWSRLSAFSLEIERGTIILQPLKPDKQMQRQQEPLVTQSRHHLWSDGNVVGQQQAPLNL